MLRQDKEHSHKPFCLLWFVSKLSIDNGIQNPHAYFCNDNLILVLHALIAQQPKMIFNIFIREPHKWKGIYGQLNPAVDQDTLDIQHCCPSEPAGPGSWGRSEHTMLSQHHAEALIWGTALQYTPLVCMLHNAVGILPTLWGPWDFTVSNHKYCLCSPYLWTKME